MDKPPFATKQKPALKWVCYFRVSTNRQGESGLGLEAQREAVTRFIAQNGGMIVSEFTEVESGRKAANRPALNEALQICRKTPATLCIAKLDRLARNVHFISGLMESSVNFIAVDQPSKDRFMLHLHAAFAEEESRRISIRTKEALAAAKRRGVDIGATGRVLAQTYKRRAIVDARRYSSTIAELRRIGCTTVRAVRDALNVIHVLSPGGGRWHLRNTHCLLQRLKIDIPKQTEMGNPK